MLGDDFVARAIRKTAPTATEPSVSSSGWDHPTVRTPMSRKQFLATGGAALAGVGMLPLVGSRRAAAATVAAKVECDSMTRSWGAGLSVINDANANNGKALRYTSTAGAAKTGVSFSTSANTVTLRLRTIKDSVWPNVSVLIDGVEVAAKYAVASSAYNLLTMSLSRAISRGIHKVEVAAPGGMGGKEEVIADWVRFDDTTSTAPPAPTPSQIALGVYAGNDQWGSTVRLDAYKALVGGFAPKIVHVFQPFKNSGGTYLPLGGSGTVALYDKYPNSTIAITWEPRQLQNTTAVTTRQIAAGQHDAYIRQQAQRLAANGKRLILRWGHEMNLDQFSWGSLADDAQKQADFIAAWRRCHNIFTQEGANAFVEWWFCPNMRAPNSPNASAMAHWYPGDAYVEWLGIDAYNFGAARGINKWLSPAQLYPQALAEVAACDGTGSKGIIVGETASHDAPGDKSQWFKDFHAYWQNAPEAARVKGIAYFHNNNNGANWRVDYPAAALDSYRAMVQNLNMQASLPVAR
jgi:mannan endo-1,4-beta-mannosidase